MRFGIFEFFLFLSNKYYLILLNFTRYFFSVNTIFLIDENIEHVYMRPEVNLNRFEISNCFEMSFRLYSNLRGDFTAAAFQTIARLYCTCANDIF